MITTIILLSLIAFVLILTCLGHAALSERIDRLEAGRGRGAHDHNG